MTRHDGYDWIKHVENVLFESKKPSKYVQLLSKCFIASILEVVIVFHLFLRTSQKFKETSLDITKNVCNIFAKTSLVLKESEGANNKCH